MSLHLYNSKTRQKERFTPLTPNRVGMYSCGPTVYSDPHLGHARGPIIMDVLRRWLTHLGYSVRYVSNVTDVGHLTDDFDDGEDKLLKRAKLEQLEPMEIAEKYFWAYFDAMAKLNVARPDIVPRATGHIPEQIEMTQQLLERGLAYERGGSVYFDVSAWQDYGELSGRDPDDLIEGTRIAARTEKNDPRDFALWKRAEPEHIMRWDSPWGEGYPGWHIECSVMSTKYLGDTFDIHGGGLDLIFPHHECELAQARAAGKDFARYWLHWNMITLEGEKMAKSKNHFVTLEDLFHQVDPLVVRFHLLRSHYRSISDFTEESLHSSQQGLRRLHETYLELKNRADDSSTDDAALKSFTEAFESAVNDDLNTPQAIAALFDAARFINTELTKSPSRGFINAAKGFFDTYLVGVLGVPPLQESASQLDTLAGVLELVMAQRQKARLARDFATSDEIRDRLLTLGITLEDTPEGSRWRLK
jgi:cysteinyl-tRNA synthetase